MITLCVLEDGNPYVWNSEDWLSLREKHRIVGQLIGVNAHQSFKDCFHGLPLALLQEEATLLTELKIARLVKFPSLFRCPGEQVLKAYMSHFTQTMNEQAQLMLEERKKTLVGLVDKIIEGRRRKSQGIKFRKKIKIENEDKAEAVNISDHPQPVDDCERETVMKEELSKIPPLSKEHALVQTSTAYPWLELEDGCPVTWSFPSSSKEKLKYSVFRDLWEKGFYISSGAKFGGDYIVYPGDPVKFHSQFIVICVDHEAPLTGQEIVSYGRIGSTVRKTVVLASVNARTKKLTYQSIKWAGSELLY